MTVVQVKIISIKKFILIQDGFHFLFFIIFFFVFLFFYFPVNNFFETERIEFVSFASVEFVLEFHPV